METATLQGLLSRRRMCRLSGVPRSSLGRRPRPLPRCVDRWRGPVRCRHAGTRNPARAGPERCDNEPSCGFRGRHKRRRLATTPGPPGADSFRGPPRWLAHSHGGVAGSPPTAPSRCIRDERPGATSTVLAVTLCKTNLRQLSCECGRGRIRMRRRSEGCAKCSARSASERTHPRGTPSGGTVARCFRRNLDRDRPGRR